ncbi:MAG: response regulator [Bryobacterales bacterium]|nr:response regulator [Bryobacterales bacterium]
MPARILIVDDDPLLIRFTEKYLVRHGYEAHGCRTAGEAWQRMCRSEYGLVLIDVSLPAELDAMSAEDLALRLLDTFPHAGVLLWSGYPFSLEDLRTQYGSRIGFLHKPFTPAALLAAVEGVAPPA